MGDLFDSDDEDEMPKVAITAKPPTNTQVENDTGLKDFTTSIFGDDSDDDDDDIFGSGDGTAAIPSKYNFDDDDDDDVHAALEDSDDDEDANFSNKRKRLSKSKSSLTKNSAVSQKQSKKNKLSSVSKGDQEDVRIKKKSKEKRLKRPERATSKPGDQTGAAGEAKGDSGDEYDSGDDVVANADDEKFIARDDDLDYLVKEYDEEGQAFDDERPDLKKKKSSKKAGSSGGGGDAGSGVQKEKDPLTLTMEMLKKPKQVVMSDNEKAQITTDLLTKMEIACRQDDDMYRRGEPAIYKLQLLPVVQKIVGMKTLHTTLLDYDVLAAMKEWIEPRDSKTLPSLAVRTAVYEMLLRLPCQVDHLKRCAAGKQPIGVTIVALRKHQSETIENKRLLKEIIEKWCRPIFGKSTDPRSMSSGFENPEMREIAVMRLQQQRQDEINKIQSSQGNASGTGKGGLNSLLGGVADPKKTADTSRARTPFSSGFLFTVQPEFKPIRPNGNEEGGRVYREEGMDESRTKMLRVMKDASRGGAATVGIKKNPRAMNVSLNGRSK